MRLAMSQAASGLLRCLIARSGAERDRVLLTDWVSTDWQSLTFVGERHEARLRISGPDSVQIAGRLLKGLAEAEFQIPGHIVADITAVGEPQTESDGSTILKLEALTVQD